jgi:hypothetical protein
MMVELAKVAVEAEAEANDAIDASVVAVVVVEANAIDASVVAVVVVVEAVSMTNDYVW